jgi:hypothetical protein
LRLRAESRPIHRPQPPRLHRLGEHPHQGPRHRCRPGQRPALDRGVRPPGGRLRPGPHDRGGEKHPAGAHRASSPSSPPTPSSRSASGFGGSCFQQDILNLVVLCGHDGLHEVAAYWQQVVSLNTWQQHRISALVVRRLFGTVSGKRIAVLGFAYGLRPTPSTRPTPTTPARPRRSASSATAVQMYCGAGRVEEGWPVSVGGA